MLSTGGRECHKIISADDLVLDLDLGSLRLPPLFHLFDDRKSRLANLVDLLLLCVPLCLLYTISKSALLVKNKEAQPHTSALQPPYSVNRTRYRRSEKKFSGY